MADRVGGLAEEPADDGAGVVLRLADAGEDLVLELGHFFRRKGGPAEHFADEVERERQILGQAAGADRGVVAPGVGVERHAGGIDDLVEVLEGDSARCRAAGRSR